MEDVAREVRSAGEAPGPGLSDADFLATLASARRVRANRIRGVLGGLALAASVALAVLLPVPRPDPVPVVAVSEPAPVETDPMAALMLESARIRLDGIGDPAVGVARLRELVATYPDSPSAREAETLLAKLEERER
jgi:hypothetical protein